MAAVAPYLAVCPVMIGQRAERDALRRLIDQALAGRCQGALIAGEAGVGKSRLAAEAKAYAAERGFALLQGSCFPQDSACPYAPLIDLLRARLASGALPPTAVAPFAHELAPLLPDLVPLPPEPPPAPALDPAQQQRRLFNALASCLAATLSQPVLLVVEDLHWCDESSLDFLLYLLRHPPAQPLLLVATLRSDEVGPRLGRWLAQLERERLVHEVPLAPLDRDEVAAMIRAIFALSRPVRPETLDAVYRLTEGNPFFVEELLKSLIVAGDIFYADGGWDRKPMEALRIPRSLNDAVTQRVVQLSEDARRVLTLGAVIGRRFDFALVQRLAHLHEGALLAMLKELIAAQLVVEESAERFAFRHALTRQAIYAGLLARERAALHRLVAEETERCYADALDPHSADLAYHYFEAGSWERALHYARRAGERAWALGSPLAAVEQYTRALAAGDALGVAPDPALSLARGRAYETLGDFEHARTDYERALELARAATDVEATWQSMIALGQLWASRDYQQTGLWFGQALDVAQALGEPCRLARSLNRLGNWHVNRGEAKEGLRLHEQALTLFEAEGDGQGMADTLDLLGMANGLYGDAHSSVQQFGRAIELYRTLGDHAGLSSALVSRAMFSGGVCCDPTICAFRSAEACAEDLAEALRLARQIEWLPGVAYAEYTAAQVYEAFGSFGPALAHAQAALEIATSIDHRQWMAATHEALGQIYIELLAPEEAIRHLRSGLELARALGSAVFTPKSASSLAMAYLLSHDLSLAAATLAPVLPRDEILRSLEEGRLMTAWGMLALARGEPDGALRVAEQLIASAPGAVRGPIPVLLKLKGEALLALGRADAAARALEEARRTAEAHGLRPLLWKILRALGQAQQRLGQRKEVRLSFTMAREIVGALAATVDAADLRERFLRAALASLPQELPPTPQRAEAERFGGLTERERAVAALAAQGKSNQEIAAALVVSKRTVETHMGNILSKLGVTSRAQVIAWAIQQGLAPPAT
ncbi:MAG TPA: AAA family ATPase [Chloroflexaceae bacterium]|nr:AAA family ATPase [Chloroflexaceae bacterium]